MRRNPFKKGRKGGKYYIALCNGWVCWAYSESEACKLLKTKNVILRKDFLKSRRNGIKDNI